MTTIPPNRDDSGDKDLNNPQCPSQPFDDIEKAQTDSSPASSQLNSPIEGNKARETFDYSGAQGKTDPREIALVRKLDLRIMPIMWAMYFLNFLDRNAIANARMNHLERDLGLVGSQYNTCISILFVGYIVMQIPSNMLISSGRVQPSLYMGLCMIAWAVVSSCTALVKDYRGLVLVRFFLGIAEAPFFPGALFMLSTFYTRKEIATRISILYTGNILACAFAGLIAAATFASIDSNNGLHGWQWLFIIEGVVTFGIAMISMFLLPNTPKNTRWLTAEERTLAHDRIHRDSVGVAPSKGVWSGFKQLVMDPKIYLFMIMQNVHLSACGFNNFFPSVVKALGFNRITTLLLTCPPYFVAALAAYGCSLSSGKYNERTWHITISLSIAVVGFIISCISLNTVARFISMFLFTPGAYAVNSIILGWVASTFAQTTEKKAVALSFVNVCGNLSYVYTAYLYPKSDEPKYLTGMAANAGFAAATILAAWGAKLWLMRKNAAMRKSNNGTRVFYAY